MLEPFHYATKIISARKYETASSAFYVKQNLKTFLLKIGKTPEQRDIKAALLRQFKYHCEEKLSNFISYCDAIALIRARESGIGNWELETREILLQCPMPHSLCPMPKNLIRVDIQNDMMGR